MAHEESDRENLMREATALVERIELGLAGEACAADSDYASEAAPARIVIGFRSNGAVSIFFGDDPVYQFNAAGQLRRAYSDGLLYKAVRGRIVSLQRVRQQNEVQLLSRELTDAEHDSFTAIMQVRLRGLVGRLVKGTYCVVGQIPADVDVLTRVRDWLAVHDGTPIANTPRA